MPLLITVVGVRVTQEELDDLRQLAGLQKAPVSSVIRAMIRDYLLAWRRDRTLTLQLGAVTFRRPDA